MDKRRMNHITVGFIVVMALVIAVMFGNNLRRPPQVVLPDTIAYRDLAPTCRTRQRMTPARCRWCR